ncbi:MAG: 4Fe-4S dicluster domain-containing protein [Chloroflexota bacterium]|nr:4Fe-4S dicluster domain-containing protein [Chloroflexota bacterium]
MSRRQALLALAAAGSALAAGPLLAPLVQVHGESDPADPTHAGETPLPPRRWAMVIDLRRCDGCKKCTEACQAKHYLPPEQEWIKVYTVRDRTGVEVNIPRLCMHCEDAPCVRVCPVTATFVDRDGLVLVDQDKCIGCRLCMAACPYEARYFNWTEPKVKPPLPTKATPEYPSPQQRGTVGKCVLCVHNIKYGELPYCLEACTMDAIYVGDLDADVATNGTETVRLSTFLSENNAIRLKEELNTKPRVWYIPGHGEDLGW